MSDEPSIDPQPGEIGDGLVEIPGATEIVSPSAEGAIAGSGRDRGPAGGSGADAGEREGGEPVPDLTGARSEPLDPAADLGSGGGSTTSDPGRQNPIQPGRHLDE